MFKKICVIGVGLIGGSIAKAARHYQLADNIVGFGRTEDLTNLQLAQELGVIDAFYTDIEKSVNQADLVILATPVSSTESILKLLKPFWSAETIYSDVGSTKVNVIDAIKNVFGEIPSNFIPAHPIAGAENSGVQAAKVDLFFNKRLILTPIKQNQFEKINMVTDFWKSLGSLVSIMDAQEHDQILAVTSHLPHLLAFALVDMLGHKDEQSEIFKYAAGGFRDFTRIASSDPLMWQSICQANKIEILPLIQEFKDELTKIEQLFNQNNFTQLSDLFIYANQSRQRFLTQFENPLNN